MNNLILKIIIMTVILAGIFLYYSTKNNNTLNDYLEKEAVEDNGEVEEKPILEENQLEKKSIISENNHMDYIITLKTSLGEISFETYTKDAPNTVQNFINLSNKGFYDKIIFHRVIAGFMIQSGDPIGTGSGGPGYSFDDEINPDSELYNQGYIKGTVAMANRGPNTQGSQFFIMVEDYQLPPLYTIFGKVVSGQEVADKISKTKRDVNDKPLENITINNVIIEEIK